MNTQVLKLALVGSVGLLLVACGGRSSVVTQDDSAEYNSARTLPPLKKPQAETAAPAQGSAPPPAVIAPAPAPTAAPAVQAQPTSLAPQSRGIVNARVNEKKNGQVELELEGDIDAAWAYLRANLNKSDITVHTRNKAAGRFSIGCAGIDPDGTVEVTKKGGWSVFRRKQQELEHCALQILADRKVTRVTAFDRSGGPVEAQLAKALFNRLLNN